MLFEITFAKLSFDDILKLGKLGKRFKVSFWAGKDFQLCSLSYF